MDENMNFGEALAALKDGAAVQRDGWNGAGLKLRLQHPDANSKMTLPYVYLEYPASSLRTPGARVPWTPSQADMLAGDWRIVE